MQKIILILVYSFFITAQAVLAAPSMRVEEINYNYESQLETNQYIKIHCNTNSSWRLSISSFDNIIRSSENPSKTLPLDIIQVGQINQQNLHNIRPDRSYIIDSGSFGNNFTKRFIIKIKKADGFYPGSYIARLKFTLSSQNGEIRVPYNLRFKIPKKQEMSLVSNKLNMNIRKQDLLKKNRMFRTSYPAILSIKSNTNWRLYIKSKSKSGLINKSNNPIEFKVLSSPKGVFCLSGNSPITLTDDYKLIAKGKACATKDYRCKKQDLKIEYFFHSKKNLIQPAGNYNFDVEYYLTSDGNNTPQ